MAITYRDSSALEQADECERRAIEFAHQAGSRRVTALAGWAGPRSACGEEKSRWPKSGRALRHGLSRSRRSRGRGDALRLIGVARTLQGKLDPAARRWRRRSSLTREHGAALNEAETLRALAEWAAAKGNPDVARAHARSAVALLERLGAAEDAGAVLLSMEENLLPNVGNDGTADEERRVDEEPEGPQKNCHPERSEGT